MGQRQLRWLMFVLLFLSLPLIVTPLRVWQQGVVAVLLVLTGWLVVRIEQHQTNEVKSEYLHLFLVWLSVVTTLRYFYYRTSYTLNFDSWLNGTFSALLYVAELYAVLTLVLAYFQTLKIKDRKPVSLAAIPQNQWFKVDIYIPTYNEDVEIVRKTALAALAIDYPEDKKRVYILDDGRAEKYRARREQLRQMCQELGCTLMTREDNEHAKAGNINTALKKTSGDLVMILDCDHIPTRQFLQHTAGFFYDEKVALVQTPHWFYNPDPFERNLLTQGQVPVGNELFYKVLQKGNDFWNAAFFCGSAAVIRRDYVLQIGGIATETVTEDCHTSLRLHSLGYKSVYYDKIMVAGLAPETFSSYVGQQVRWARGMAQILRIENPLFNPKLKLSLPQRICYFSATSHFFYGFPRLMYAIAPTLFLIFAINPIQGIGVETLAYALPHIALALNANFIPYKNVRFSFWNEIFEFTMSYQATVVTFLALINPKLGSFNVTDKGLSVTKRNFDWSSVKHLLVVLAMVVLALIAVPFWLVLRPESTEAVLVNTLWSLFNLCLLVSAILVAFEQPQLRRAHRLQRRLRAAIHSPTQTWRGETIDVSETGARILLDTWPDLPDTVDIQLLGDTVTQAIVHGKIIRAEPMNESQVVLVVDFVDLTQMQQDALALVLYSDVTEWYSQNRPGVDDPFGSFRFIVSGLSRAFLDMKPAKGVPLRRQIQAPVQLYWEGHFWQGHATELGAESMRVQLDAAQMQHLEDLRDNNPLVGVLVSQDKSDPSPKRLLVEVAGVKDMGQGAIALELLFPEKLMGQQDSKIKHLLRTLPRVGDRPLNPVEG